MASEDIRLFVNGKEKVVRDADPRWTLLHYLRTELHLTGTKLGCGEGGCGACTVMLSSQKPGGEIRHMSANACLTPVCALDGVAVTTVEGIGAMKDGLHPIQQRLAEAHGSQCGFCTPGIVMALYAQLRANPNATPHELEESMDGNLCRCTGYRPIIDAVRSLSNNKGGLEAPSGQAEAVPNPAAASGGGCCQGSGGSCPCKETLPKGVQTASSEEKVNGADSLEMEMRSKGRSEPIFPPALMQYASRSLKVTRDGFSWYQPTTLPELLALKNQFPQARLVAGNTEVGIETKFKNMKYTEIVCPSHVPELLVTSVEKNVGVTIGASVTVNGLRSFINSLTDRVTEIEGAGWAGMLRGLNAINDQITWFASNQIRNVAAIGGNIVTASPIGDLNPMLISQQAVATLVSTTGTRQVPLSEFFLGYRKVDLQPTEILQSVFVPFTQELEFCVPLKQARRREDDISIVTGCVRVKLTPDTAQGCWLVEDFGYALGGMAPTPVSAKAVNAAAKGKKWDFKLLSDHLYDAIKEELSLPAGVPGGQSEYRTTLVASFLFRSFLAITGELTTCIDAKPSGALPPAPTVEGSELSGAEGFVTKEKPSSRGQQNYYVSEGAIQTAQEKDGLHSEPAGEQKQSRPPVGQPVMHKSALMQVTGEAMYTNDTALPRNALHAMLVMSTKPHAKLLGVDISEAEKCEGFHSYLDHKSVTGHNQIGAVFKDEEVFAVDTVRYVGMVIGVILADTHDNAVAASKAVKVSYEDLPAAVSIEEAIAAKSFYPEVHEIRTGDVEAAANNADFVVEGTSSVGQQEHFYLETNATVALPTEHGHLEIIASTQNLSKTQAEVAAVTGLPMGQVVCKAKRLGGGFGGKEERSIFITVTAALAAHLTGRAVSILIERDVDMSITGQRHSFQFDYKAGCNKDGKLVFLDAMLYSNAGWSLDLSQAVMDRALFHSDNCYHWPAQRVRGTLCKTNQPSHTAFRGFGGPQGMMLTEFVMKHLAAKSGIHIDELRTRNWYKDGIRTHFGQVMEGFHVPRIFDSMQDNCDIAQRKKNIEAFNAVNKWKKRGLCQLPTKFGINFTAKFLNQGGALVHVYTDGTVLISHGGTEMGQGLHTKMVQVAAQCFGIHHSMVTCLETATTSVANSSPTAASASTDLYGMAVLNACEQIRERLDGLRDGIRAEGKFSDSTCAQTRENDLWKKTVNTAYFSRINLSAQGFYAVPTERCGYDWTMDVSGADNAKRGHPFNYFTQGVCACEVEIDCLTGDSHVIRCDIVMDVGKSINPAIDIGQIEGAFTQGYGWATMEEMIWGDSQHPWVRPGQLFTKGPGTYKIPAFNDVPRDFRVHLYDTENKYCVHSSKAVGEPPFFLGSAAFWAIMEAVQAARKERGLDANNGYFPLQCPATSERIRMACADEITTRFMLTEGTDHTAFQPKGSW